MVRQAIALFLVPIIFVVSSVTALSIDLSNAAFAPSGDTTSIPVGHMEFCRSRPLECGRNQTLVPAIALDQALWTELLTVNARFNAEVQPVSDDDLYRVAEY